MKASAEFENHVPFHNDHNVYSLCAGFSSEAEYPLVRNFMDKMREAASWQKDHGKETKEIEAVLKFRLLRHIGYSLIQKMWYNEKVNPRGGFLTVFVGRLLPTHENGNGVF